MEHYFHEHEPGRVLPGPAAADEVPALLAWLGGALFTAKIRVGPFYAANFRR